MRYKTYYDRTDAAQELVFKTLKANSSIERCALVTAITMSTGLGSGWLDKFLQPFIDMGQIKAQGDVLSWNKGVSKK